MQILRSGTPEFTEIFLTIASKLDKQQVLDYHPTDPKKIKEDIQALSNFDDPVSIPRPIMMEFKKKLAVTRD